MTYLYETIPARPDEVPRQFEIKQAASEAPLTKHPETGEPIRRVILGGWGLLKGARPIEGSSGGCGCGPGECC